jgi:predicted component of type VI protein secretion system
MAKLYLRFEGKELKEVTVSQSAVITIGRLPDNLLQIDNLAVSGHHAKIYWDGEQYTLEDNGSLNGTYVNNQRVTKHRLKNGDTVLIGKHSVEFKDEWHDDHNANAPAAKAGPAVPQMQSTVVLDTKKAKEMMAQARAASAAPTGTVPEMKAPSAQQLSEGAVPPKAPTVVPPVPAKERTGMLTVIDGKTDEPSYLLSSKMSVIGKSAMASIKLKGSFFKSPPEVAAMVSKRENKYYITQQDKHANVKVNGEDASTGQRLLDDGDIVEVAGVKMSFAWHE